MYIFATQMPEVADLDIAANTLYLILIIAGLFLFAWLGTFYFLKDHSDHMKHLMHNGNLVKILTIAIVVVAASILSVLGVFSVGIASLFGSIAGFVLGSIGVIKLDVKETNGAPPPKTHGPT